jgi:hypothetical protein
MSTVRQTRRHIAVRNEVARRVEMRVAQARTLAKRTRMMIARLDRQLSIARRATETA